ncbi:MULTISPECIES: glycosyltransferase [Spirulina sp. CCY15215]|uniref:glycosyltransferase family 2 protein n=1 Tax=Spirulina sp. CCY15215 TaxID=2767591 RepID=UPI00194E2733|nr:glycosyltransferase [Spirulina major]
MNSQAISVIIPLFDPRGQALKCVRSWVEKQTCDRSQYEVIVVADGTQSELESQIQPLLQPQDSLLHCQPEHEYELYNIGAQNARGSLLLLTELHCIAASNCITEVLDYFTTQNYDAACCRSESLNPNLIAKVEAKLFSLTVNSEREENYFDRLLVRGFAIPRSLYLEMGGFEWEFGRFCERVLSTKLHSQGYKLGYMTNAIVAHCNNTTIAASLQPSIEFVYGEFCYREKYPASYCDRYFGDLPLWSNRAIYRQQTAQMFASILAQNFFSEKRKEMPQAMKQLQQKAFWQAIISAYLGMHWFLWKAWFKLSWSYLWAWFMRFDADRLYSAYNRYWQATIPYGRYKYLAEHLNQTKVFESEVYCYNFAELNRERLIGFHGLETWQGQSFCWSEPIASILVSLAPNTYNVRVETLPVRPQNPPLHLQIFCNDRPIPNFTQNPDGTGFSFEISQKMFLRVSESSFYLTFLMNPLRLWEQGSSDRRELGLAIQEINFDLV